MQVEPVITDNEIQPGEKTNTTILLKRYLHFLQTLSKDCIKTLRDVGAITNVSLDLFQHKFFKMSLKYIDYSRNIWNTDFCKHNFNLIPGAFC